MRKVVIALAAFFLGWLYTGQAVDKVTRHEVDKRRQESLPDQQFTINESRRSSERISSLQSQRTSDLSSRPSSNFTHPTVTIVSSKCCEKQECSCLRERHEQEVRRTWGASCLARIHRHQRKEVRDPRRAKYEERLLCIEVCDKRKGSNHLVYHNVKR